LAWLVPLAGHVDGLFGLNGWFDRQAYREAARLVVGPPHPFTWSILYLCGSNTVLLRVVYWLSVATLMLFTLGLWTRLTAVLAWVVVASFTANPALVTDADSLLLILAFYVMVGYLLRGFDDRVRSWPRKLLSASPGPSVAANVALRLLQVHLALVMVISGLHKLQFADWWSGVALWYPLHPPLEMTPGKVGTPANINSSLLPLSLAAYAVLTWQVGFPAFAWRRAWRFLLVGGAVAGWLGCVLIYRVPVYGPALVVGCLAFLSADEWYWLFGVLSKVPGLHRFAARFPAAPAVAKENLVPV
jgi:hypothetical protein